MLTQETYIGTLREHFPEITLEEQAQSRGKIYVASVAGSAQQVTAGAQGESRRALRRITWRCGCRPA